jgi:hypothetical protein
MDHQDLHLYMLIVLVSVCPVEHLNIPNVLRPPLHQAEIKKFITNENQFHE